MARGEWKGTSGIVNDIPKMVILGHILLLE